MRQQIILVLLFILTIITLSNGQKLLPYLEKAEQANQEEDTEKIKRIYFEMISKIDEKLDTTVGYACQNLGFFYIQEGKMDSAKHYYEWCYNYYLERNSAHYGQHFASSIAELLRYEGNNNEQIDWLRKGINDYKIEGCRAAELLSQYGDVFTNTGNLDSAEYYLNLSLSLCPPESSHINKMIYRRLAKLERSKGNYPKSINYYLKDIDNYLPVQPPNESYLYVSNAYKAIQRLFLQMEDFEKTDEFLTKSENIAKEHNYKRALTSLLKERALYFLGLGQLDSALIYINRHIEEKKSVKAIPNNQFNSAHYLARIYVEKGEILNAKNALKKATEVFDKITSNAEKSNYHLIQGRIYSESGQYQSAILEMNKALDFASKAESKAHQMKVHKYLANTYFDKGNYKEAAINQNKYSTYRDSLFKTQRDQVVYELEGKFQKAQQDLEIANLNLKNTTNQEAIASKNRQLFYGLAALIVMGILGMLTYLLYRNKKKAEEELAVKNAIISKQLAEKDLLLREIHHRVKNNLQVVSSLLNVQSQYLTDDTAKLALDEGRNRVKSMSLIHQNLYSGENLTTIDIKTYFEKLVEELFNSYQISKDTIHLNLKIESIEMDVDTIVPLGLIANELISNALKHAFNEQPTGILSISLQKKDNVINLKIEDNGKGFSQDEFDSNSNSFGYQMINAFTEQLDAKLMIEKLDNGTAIQIQIPMVD